MVETFPRNRLSARGAREVKQLAWCLGNSFDRHIAIRYRVSNFESRVSNVECRITNLQLMVTHLANLTRRVLDTC